MSIKTVKDSYMAHGKTINVSITFNNKPSDAALKNYANVMKEIVLAHKKEVAK